jgi:hypothetical protein
MSHGILVLFDYTIDKILKNNLIIYIYIYIYINCVIYTRHPFSFFVINYEHKIIID